MRIQILMFYSYINIIMTCVCVCGVYIMHVAIHDSYVVQQHAKLSKVLALRTCNTQNNGKI